MAADDDRGPEPDPWEDLGAADSGEDGGEIAYRFEESLTGDAEESGGHEEFEAAAAEASAAEPADDGMVADWLSGTDATDDNAVPPLTVFPAEDAVGGSPVIDTGSSGIESPGESTPAELTADAFPAADGESMAADWPTDDAESVTNAGDAAAELGTWDTPAAAATGAAAAAATGAKPVVRRPAKPAKKSSPIGQLIGVVMGGLLAIPITLAILIYGLGKDPFGVTKKVPGEVAFLLPAKFRPGFKKPVVNDGVDGAGGSALDNLPTITEPADPAPPVEPEPESPVGEPAPAEPAAVADAAADMPPEPAPPADVVAIDAPSLDNLVPEPAPAPVPPPLDTSKLDEAVAEAAALGEALGAVDDRENGAYRKLRTRWYRALARMAEELVAVENAAATSGRPLGGAPDNVAALHGGIGDRESLGAELAALAPDWLAYAKRGSDGVVLPVTFESARRVGPYWTVRASLTGSDGTPKDLTVIARSEPAAISGDRVVVTGVALDGSVVWAADIRGLAAGGEASPGF